MVLSGNGENGDNYCLAFLEELDVAMLTLSRRSNDVEHWWQLPLYPADKNCFRINIDDGAARVVDS